MNKSTKFIFFFTLALQVYATSIWIYVFNNFPNQSERKLGFSKYFPTFLTGSVLNAMILILTVTTIVLVIKDINGDKHTKYNSVLIYAILVIELLFLFFFIFQNL